MDIYEILVTLIGLISIIWIIWFFFFPERKVFSTRIGKIEGKEIQEINIKVKGGYEPSLIEVKKGIPVRFNFYRDETDSCSARVKIPDFNIIRDLPEFKTTTIEFIPKQSGEYEFTCGMGMLRGKIIIK